VRSASVVTGGVLGTLARWWVGEILQPSPLGSPWGTLIVNVTGAFALGVVGVEVLLVVPCVAMCRLVGSSRSFGVRRYDGTPADTTRMHTFDIHR
jgi:fluoride ion exporter CrcB/FEX